MTNLIDYANQVMEKYPSLKSDVQGLIQLCIDEIEEGSPERHEIQLCWSDIDALIKEEEIRILSKHI
jgi:hypothetical protein